MATHPVPTLLTVSDVSHCLQMSTETISRWIRTDHLAGIRFARTWRVNETALAGWLRERAVEGSS